VQFPPESRLREYCAVRAAEVAVNFDGMPEDDVALWQRQLKEADRDVRFVFVSMPVLTTGVSD